MNIQDVPISALKPYENNPRRNDDAVDAVAKSIETFGFKVPLVIDKGGGIICGHTRHKAAEKLGMQEVPCIVADDLTPEQIRAFRLVDNKTNELSGWDFEKLDAELAYIADLNDEIFNVDMTEFGFSELPPVDQNDEFDENVRGRLSERFLFVPFSVLDSRRGDWQDRKNFWIKTVGIRSKETRENIQSLGAFSGSTPHYYAYKAKCEKLLGRKLTNKEFEKNYLQDYIPKDSIISSTNSGGILSIFDPVLCELMYYWFCPESGSVLDPFAGGNVRGLVAAFTGHSYTGVDIRQDQIDTNNDSASELLKDQIKPHWICGNSMEINSLVEGSYDMIFSCPPYFDLEKYSDNPDDISNMTYGEFLECYRTIIKKSVAFLKDNRFAVFVVGDIRDKKTGMYRNFVSETISAFHAAGANLYNEIILVTQVGSLPIRISNNFKALRKVGKTHQNVLVFYKGDDQRQIKDVFTDINILEFEENKP